MKWTKVFAKFLKGILVGGVAAVINKPPVSSEEFANDSIVALIVGIASAVMNWFKHKDD